MRQLPSVVLCLLLLAVVALLAPPCADAPAATTPSAQTPLSPEALRTGAAVGADKTERVRRQYEKVRGELDRYVRQRSRRGAGEAAPPPASVQRAVATLYAAGGDDAPSILKNMLKAEGAGALSAEHGQLIAELRAQWFYDAAVQVCKEKKVSLGLLDSGTEGSVANDVDKTLRVLKQFGDPVDEASVMHLIEQRLAQRVEAETGVKGMGIGGLDIEMFSGREFYTSAMHAKAPAVYKAELTEVLLNKMKNKAAYVTDGSTKMQVIQRALEKQQALRDGRLESGAAFTRLEYDPQTGNVIRDEPANWLDLVELSGEIHPHDAFGSALGNHLMLIDKSHKVLGKPSDDPHGADSVKDDVAKYLTRGVLDTKTTHDPQRIKELRRYELDEFKDEASRRKLIQEVCGIDPWSDPNEAARLNQYRVALDISQAVLNNKKHRAAGATDRVKPDAEVFGELGVMMAGSHARFNAEPDRWIARAKSKYPKIAERMSMRIMTHQFPDAVKTWLSPDPALVARARRYDPNFENQNVRILGMVLLRSAHDGLPPEQWRKLVNNAPLEDRVDLENLQRMLRWKRVEPQGPDHARRTGPAPDEAPPPKGAVQRLLARWRPNAEAIANRPVNDEQVAEWSRNQLEDSFPAAEGAQKRFGLDDAMTRLHEGFRHAIPSVLDIGNADSLLTLVQAYQEAEAQGAQAQRDAVKRALWDEMINRIPYVGEARGVYRSMESQDAQAAVESITPILERALGGGFAGPALLYVGISKKFVSVVGHEIFYPVRHDAIDIVYKGYVEASEHGILRTGRKIPEGYRPANVPSLLSRVPLRFMVLRGELLDQLLQNDSVPQPAALALVKEIESAGEQPAVIFVDLSRDYGKLASDLRRRLADLRPDAAQGIEAQFLADLSHQWGQVFDVWQRQAVLGQLVRDRIAADPHFAFEARRQNTYRRFRDVVERVFQRREDEPRTVEQVYADFDADDAQLRGDLWSLRGATLAQVAAKRAKLEQRRRDLASWLASFQTAETQASEQVFLKYVQDWTAAQGDFADLDENLAARFVWHDEQIKRGLVERLATDYRASRMLTMAADGALRLLPRLADAAEQRAQEMRNRRLAALYQQALPDVEQAPPAALVKALAPQVKQTAHVDLKAVIVSVKDDKGQAHKELQVEASIDAVPLSADEQWQSRPPQITPIDARQVPDSALSRLGVRRDEIGSAFAITMEVFRTGQPTPFATGRTYMVTRRATTAPPVKPPEQPKLPPLLLSRLFLRMTTPDEHGSTVTKSTPIKQMGAAATFKLPDASGQLTLTLDAPDKLQPTDPFTMAAALQFNAQTSKSPLVVGLSPRQGKPAPHDQRTVAPGQAAGGDIAIKREYRFRLLGQKSYEWNALYRPQGATDSSDDAVLNYNIRSDAPSFDGVEQSGAGDTQVQGGIPKFRQGRAAFTFVGQVRRDDVVIAKLEITAEYALTGGKQFTPFGAGQTANGAGNGAGNGDGEGNGAGNAQGNPQGGAAPGGAAPAYIGQSAVAGAGGAAGQPGAVTATAAAPADDPLAVLRSARPWDDPQVQQLIEQWLSISEPAVPPSNENDHRRWRWSQWGVMESPPSVRATGPPDHGGMSRPQYLYTFGDRLVSRRHYTLRDYIRHRLLGESGEHDAHDHRATGSGLQRALQQATQQAAPQTALQALAASGQRGAGAGRTPTPPDPPPAKTPTTVTGQWKGMAPLLKNDEIGVDMEVHISQRGGQYELTHRAGKMVFAQGTPIGQLTRRSDGSLTIMASVREKAGADLVTFYEMWTFRLQSNGTLRLEVRNSRDKPDWSHRPSLVYTLRRIGDASDQKKR